MKGYGIWLVLLVACAASSAQAVDARLEGAKLCTTQIPKYEREYGVPAHLLSAISSAETGRWHEGLKITLPWPWTINAEGKGYWFDTKQEAIAAAKAMQARGVKSMDLGCMQVNIYHHPNAFRSIEDGFDPQTNIAYAASFLRTLYESEGSWKEAAAAYHSKTPERGLQYVSRVFDKWRTILTRLRMPADAIQTASAPNGLPVKMPIALNRLPPSPTTAMNLPVRSKTLLSEQIGKNIAKQEPIKMKIIEVAKINRARESGVLVVRPDVAPEVADNAKPFQLAAANTRVVNVASLNRAAPAAAPVSEGPRFIFND